MLHGCFYCLKLTIEQREDLFLRFRWRKIGVAGDVTASYLETLEKQRNDTAKRNQDLETNITRNLYAHL